MSLYSVKERK